MKSAPNSEAVSTVISEIRALGALVERLPAPSAAPPAISEDLTVIGNQARSAVEAMVRLEELSRKEWGSELDVLLHRMNNYFTGIASLATLCRDDVRGAPALSAHLQDVEQQARRAADRVRDLARGQR